MRHSEDVQDQVLRWIGATRADPLSAELVPGADEQERRHLAALGGLVRALVDDTDRDRWPEAVRGWIGHGPEPPAQLAVALERGVQRDPSVLADLYATIVSGPNRRRLGTFFTPRPVVHFMIEQASAMAQAGPVLVIDPGAGVGAFSLSTAIKWPSASVQAVDLNVVTLGLLGIACRCLNVDNVALQHQDYLSWIRDAVPTAGENRSPRLFIGNPPYTRHQEFDAKVKEVLKEQALSLVTSGLAGLSAYFLAASLADLRSTDSLCFVVPSNWTEAGYGRELREWVWEARTRPVAMHVFPPRLEVFPGTKVSAMVLVVGPEAGCDQALTLHTTKLVDDRVETTEGQEHPRRGKALPNSFGPWLWPRSRTAGPAETVTLAELAVVRRGVATGCNAFFFMRDDEVGGLPEGSYVAALRRLRHVEGDLLGKREHDRIGHNGHPRWLLRLSDPDVVKDPRIERLLAEAQKDGVHNAYLAAVRDPWYLLEHVEPPDLLVTMMSKSHLRVVRNGVGAVPSNSMYGIYLNNASQARAMCEWLNSAEGQEALLQEARHYSGGLRKLEPGDLRRVLVPSQLRSRS